MSLTGNLEIFPMPEVLRLLSRSKKTGCLRVDAVETEGRVYLAGGAITFANTQSDDVVRQALINAGLVTNDSLRASKNSLPDALVEGVDPSSITDFVRELVVESLYRIRKPGHGDFEFAVDEAPAYTSGQQFDAEVALAESDRRAAEWADIFESVTNLDAPIRMVRELPDDNSVTIAAPTWKVLASLEGGTSVRELAYRTGMSEFRAARELSGLIRSELVSVVELAPTFDSGYQAPVVERRALEPIFAELESTTDSQPESEPEQDVEPTDDFESFFDPEVENSQTEEDTTEETTEDAGWESSPWDTPAEPVSNGHDADGAGWFDEAVGEVETEDDATADEPSEPTAEESTSDGGWWAAAMGETEKQADDPTSDPDSFLESVFSQLNEGDEIAGESDEDETGFSMGLLRRRRMGTAARDITER